LADDRINSDTLRLFTIVGAIVFILYILNKLPG
jgi:hypothetical protein